MKKYQISALCSTYCTSWWWKTFLFSSNLRVLIGFFFVQWLNFTLCDHTTQINAKFLDGKPSLRKLISINLRKWYKFSLVLRGHNWKVNIVFNFTFLFLSKVDSKLAKNIEKDIWVNAKNYTYDCNASWTSRNPVLHTWYSAFDNFRH